MGHLRNQMLKLCDRLKASFYTGIAAKWKTAVIVRIELPFGDPSAELCKVRRLDSAFEVEAAEVRANFKCRQRRLYRYKS